MESIAELKFDEIEVGTSATFIHKITGADVEQFASLSGDFNPLHLNDEFAATTQFGRRIVHGMFLASLFSRLVGMNLPGRYCLYMSQSLDFVQPVYIGEEVKVCGEVIHKQDATNTLVIRTEIYALPDRLSVRGKAHVRVLA